MNTLHSRKPKTKSSLPLIKFTSPKKFVQIKTEPDLINDCVRFFTIRTLQGVNEQIEQNQDSIFYSTNYNDNEDQYLFGICNGHGPDGHLISNYVANQYKRKLRISLFFGDHKSQNIKIMNQCANDIEKELKQRDDFNTISSGTTLTAVFISGDKIICQNVGSSKTVFFSKSYSWVGKELCQEHKLSSFQECYRILNSGGYISKNQQKRNGSYYIMLSDQHQLKTTRSLGDQRAKQIGVSSESEFTTFQIKQDGFLVIGTSGLWDVMNQSDIIQHLENARMIVHQRQMEDLANAILSQCKKRWETGYNNGDVMRIEDISFNLDTGDTYSFNNFGEIEIQFAQYTPLQPRKERWKNFWIKIDEINEKLYEACERGEEDVVLRLLKDQNDLKQQVQQQNRSNTGSIADDYQEFIGLVNIDFRQLDGWAALHHAVNNRRVGTVKVLLEAKANPNLQTHMKSTPLHLACLRRSFDIVRLLVQYKAEVNCQDNELNTPLHLSAEFGDLLIVEFLLKNGANALNKNVQQKTPFDMTVSPEVRKILQQFAPDLGGYNSRTQIGGQIVRNSRADHIERLLGKVNDLQKVESLKKSSSNQSQESPLPIAAAPTIEIDLNGGSPYAYTFHKLLGKGSFGEVYFVTRKSDGEVFAIKTLCKDKVFSKNLTRYAQTEKNVLSVMKHPFIVRLHAAFQSSQKLFMVLDYCPGGDLGQLLTKNIKLCEDDARFYISEIILALESLHKNCIIFRDLKPDNVVLDSRGHARLTDFGLSKEGIYDNITKSFCGSIAYLSPEVLMKRGHSRTVDWYLVGVLLYEMIVGMPPYYNQNRDQLFENIKKGVLRIPKNMSEEAKDLIKALLIRDPSQRLGAKNDAEDLKRHPFFKNVNWEDVQNKVKDGPYIERDRSKQWEKEIIDMKFDEQAQASQRMQDWSFIE